MKEKLYDPFAVNIQESSKIDQILKNAQILAIIANYLVDYRQKNKLTQKQFANLLGIKQTMVSKLESGRYNPSFKMILKISYAISNDERIFIEIMNKIEEELDRVKKYKENRLNKKVYEYNFYANYTKTIFMFDYLDDQKNLNKENAYKVNIG